MVKVHIVYKFKETAWGGGNQFLKALRDKFIEMCVYEDSPVNADIILFNSHHEFFNILKLRLKYPNKIFIHRIDGPVSAIRGTEEHIDAFIYKLNDIVADGTILQSLWSKKENKKLGLNCDKNSKVIINAPNPNIFNKLGKSSFNKNSKTKIVATSWSPNKRKGFDIYLYLDKYLDFTKYEMTFIGNSPYEFENINISSPLPSGDLAKEIKKHDIFITASQKDTCSNSLIEALHCGLPAVVLNDGGHPEIIGNFGEVFNSEDDVISQIQKVSSHYHKYANKINLPSIDSVSKQYLSFMNDLNNKYLNGSQKRKKVNLLLFLLLFMDSKKLVLVTKLKKILKYV